MKKKKIKKESKKKRTSEPLKCIDGHSLCEPNKKPAGFCNGCGG